ncbi:MAG: response regulator [Candidatus Peregrinibacteria bacterium]|nr:response regulator [Candidatus Peregrinibacteria bacterium]MDZ4244387.1 response regulator [Candidatus Gracilibacteria bacterium]
MTNKNIKIFIAEDDKFLSKIYRTRLEQEDYTIIAANNGIDAVEKIIAEQPDLILLDLLIPQKNGFDVLEELKANSTTQNIPVIILSNLGQESDVEKGMKLGAIDFLIKANFSIDEVTGKIKEHLKETK